MGEDKDMKKIISIFILLLSLTGLYALNPPAWLMGYWFEKDDSHVVICGVMKVTPDNVIIGQYEMMGLGTIDYNLNLNEINDFYDDLYPIYCIEEYTDDSYTTTLKYKATGEIINKYSFSHDTIDNKVMIYSLHDTGWLFMGSYGRTKPVNIPDSAL